MSDNESWEEASEGDWGDEESQQEIIFDNPYEEFIWIENITESNILNIEIKLYPYIIKKTYENIDFGDIQLKCLYKENDLKIYKTQITRYLDKELDSKEEEKQEEELNKQRFLDKLEKKIHKILVNKSIIEFNISDVVIFIQRFFNFSIDNTCFFCDKHVQPIKRGKTFEEFLILNNCGSLICLTNNCSIGIIERELVNNAERFKIMLYLFLVSCLHKRVPSIMPDNTDVSVILEKFYEFPPIKVLLYNVFGIRKLIDGQTYNILSWLITQYDEKISMGNGGNFIIHDLTPEKSIKFESAPKKLILNRSHGSSHNNFFNIIMGGLKNFSKTTYQQNGAAYGPGVYFGSDNTARGYGRGKLQKPHLSILKSIIKTKPVKPVNHLRDFVETYVESNFSYMSLFLRCKIYWENPTWNNTSFCTVIPINDNIIIHTLVVK